MILQFFIFLWGLGSFLYFFSTRSAYEGPKTPKSEHFRSLLRENHRKNRRSENRVFNFRETVGTIRLGYSCHLVSMFFVNFRPMVSREM